jgi:group I intron endonuclease
MKESGIYKITCKINGKLYIGSAVNLYKRWRSRHLPSLRKNTHHNRYLQAAWNKYGENAFECKTIENCAKPDLIAREQYWIDALNAADAQYGYNVAPVAGSTLGVPQSARCKAAILRAKSKTFIVRKPGGQEKTITNLNRFCSEHGLTNSAMHRVAHGKARHHRRWECRPATMTRAAWLARAAKLPAARPQKIKNEQVWCSKCLRYKHRKEFHNDRQQSYGYAPYCRDCSRVKLANYYRKRRAVQ